MFKLALIGLGPHSKRIYYPFIEKHASEFGIQLTALVELEESKESTQDFLSKRAIQPQNIKYLTQIEREGPELSAQAQDFLDQMLSEEGLDGIIIATEPKSHFKYTKWALERNVNILMDKPITAPKNCSSDINSARKVFDDYSTIKRLLSKSSARLVVQCQRRYHKGYQMALEAIKEVVEEYQVPITYMDIYHADGMWNMPPEFLFRENHPYKYGYGKLMHSGYHFIDLFYLLNKLNFNLKDKAPNNLEIYAKSLRPKDFTFQLDQDFYKKNLPNSQISDFFEDHHNIDKFGEIDVYTKIQSKRDDKVVGTASIDLLQNSFSRRAWPELPLDTYKGNGRVRHERVNIQISHLMNLQVHSYQSYEVKNKDVETLGAGAEDHFDIYIFRNSDLIGGKPLTKIPVGEKMKEKNVDDNTFIGHNERARENCFLDFIKNESSKSEFEDHEFTNRMLSKVYESLALESMGKTSITKINLKG